LMIALDISGCARFSCNQHFNFPSALSHINGASKPRQRRTCSGVSSSLHLGHCAVALALRRTMVFSVAQNPVTCLDIQIRRLNGICCMVPPIASQSTCSKL
jgi:hypothetical protein